MSFYVKREARCGCTAWVGPIRSEQQAHRERAAWEAAGRRAEVLPSTPEVRAAVRAWERAKRAR
jgi:hypothetical protein